MSQTDIDPDAPVAWLRPVPRAEGGSGGGAGGGGGGFEAPAALGSVPLRWVWADRLVVWVVRGMQ